MRRKWERFVRTGQTKGSHFRFKGRTLTSPYNRRVLQNRANIHQRQDFHADYSDIVGLLCLARAEEGGESDIVSTHHLYNTLRKERPDVVKTLIEPIWYFDRKGEVSKGQEQWTRTSVFFLEPKGSKERMFAK